ncbi:MAG: hypothetical protein HC837_12105 [Chloroflexaceae bacterium]|nr:hypothetical protein [Chloroflexaceae bacterium]
MGTPLAQLVSISYAILTGSGCAAASRAYVTHRERLLTGSGCAAASRAYDHLRG